MNKMERKGMRYKNKECELFSYLKTLIRERKKNIYVIFSTFHFEGQTINNDFYVALFLL